MLYFENRQLKREIKRLRKRSETYYNYLGQKDKEIADKDKTIQSQGDKIISLEKKLSSSNRQLKKVSKIVRAQTGADLLVNALKELGVVPLSEKEPDHFEEAKKLQLQMAGLQNQGQLQGLSNTYNGLAGQKSGLGGQSGQDSAFNRLFS